MEWQVIVALVVMVPVILAPVAIVWGTKLIDSYVANKEARAKRAAWLIGDEWHRKDNPG